LRRRRAEAAADSRSTPKTVLRGSVRGGVRPGREMGRRGTRLGGPGGAAVAGGGRSAARGGAAASVRNHRRDRATEREGKCGMGRASSPPHLAPVTNGRRRGTAGWWIDGGGARERCSVAAAQCCRARSVDGGGARERCSVAQSCRARSADMGRRRGGGGGRGGGGRQRVEEDGESRCLYGGSL